MRAFATIILLILLGTSSLLANDVITLKDGSVIEGKIYRTMENGDLCVHKIDGNDILITKTDIVSFAQNDKKFFKRASEEEQNKRIEIPAFPEGFALKVRYIYGLSTSDSRHTEDVISSYDDYSWILTNNHGASIGISYSINLSQTFAMECGLNIKFGRSLFKYTYSYYYSHDGNESGCFNDYGSSRQNHISWEIPLLACFQTPEYSSNRWIIKGGPTLTMSNHCPYYKRANTALGMQIETGLKYKKLYFGFGFNFCFWSSQNCGAYLDLVSKCHQLNVTYAYLF